MTDTISWIATAATIIAASMTAANLGARITGYGFCVFLAGSLLWIAVGITSGQPALTWTNLVLTFLNGFGIWRWLGRQARVEEGGRAAQQASEKTEGEALFPISLLTRATVRWGGKDVGHAVDAMAGTESGRIAYLVAGEGGVSGVGETFRRLDWATARVSDEAVIVDLDEGGMEALPALQKDRWPDR
jgi:hypothetical protein